MIETKRFYLRKFIKEDASMMFNNWANDKDVTKFLSWLPHKDLSASKEYIDYIIKTNQTTYAIVEKSSKEVIGSISNVKENANFTICEVGYCIGKKYWNKGIMTEVLDAYVKELFMHRNYEIIEAKHIKENVASGKVMMKCGFHFNYINETLDNKFGWVSVCCYSITKNEFLLKEFQEELSNFLGVKISANISISKTLNRLMEEGYLVKSFKLIDTPKIALLDDKNIFLVKEKENNIITYYFVGKIDQKDLFNSYIDKFVLLNNEFIICNNCHTIEQILVKALKKHHLTISFAESCTGGMMASSIINVSGASDVIKESYVVYSEDAKMSVLGVKKQTLKDYTVYSKQTAYEMAKGLRLKTLSDICVSITGLAGGDVPTANDGTFFSTIIFNINGKEETINFRKVVKGKRNEVRTMQTNYIFYKIIKVLEKSF